MLFALSGAALYSASFLLHFCVFHCFTLVSITHFRPTLLYLLGLFSCLFLALVSVFVFGLVAVLFLLVSHTFLLVSFFVWIFVYTHFFGLLFSLATFFSIRARHFISRCAL